VILVGFNNVKKIGAWFQLYDDSLNSHSINHLPFIALHLSALFIWIYDSRILIANNAKYD